MADSREGNVIVAPGYTQKAVVLPVEILASESGVFQKGCTLAASQGVLRGGLALKVSNDEYSGAAASEHASVVGFLRDSVDASAATPIHEANIVFGAKALKASTIHYSDTVQDARTVADAVFNSTTTVTSATAVFTAEDVGRTITGAGIPVGATITARGSATSITISAATTTTGSAKTITVGANVNGLAAATLTTLAGDMGGKYIAQQGYFKF